MTNSRSASNPLGNAERFCQLTAAFDEQAALAQALDEAAEPDKVAEVEAEIDQTVQALVDLAAELAGQPELSDSDRVLAAQLCRWLDPTDEPAEDVATRLTDRLIDELAAQAA